MYLTRSWRPWDAEFREWLWLLQKGTNNKQTFVHHIQSNKLGGSTSSGFKCISVGDISLTFTLIYKQERETKKRQNLNSKWLWNVYLHKDVVCFAVSMYVDRIFLRCNLREENAGNISDFTLSRKCGSNTTLNCSEQYFFVHLNWW